MEWTNEHQREALIRVCEIAIELTRAAKQDFSPAVLDDIPSSGFGTVAVFRDHLDAQTGLDAEGIDREVAIVRQRAECWRPSQPIAVDETVVDGVPRVCVAADNEPRTRYVVVTLSDAQTIATAIRYLFHPQEARALEIERGAANLHRVAERLRHETGDDIQQIVDLLKATEPCAACSIEGQLASCSAWGSQKLGRRLRRLLERARGVRES